MVGRRGVKVARSFLLEISLNPPGRVPRVFISEVAIDETISSLGVALYRCPPTTDLLLFPTQ